ncbi:hypothetical protein GYA25_02910 [Candidatus Woesearchaeota archaeon]|nr:hypothetical protein [Candidatus Woesearchaeota archaeon]
MKNISDKFIVRETGEVVLSNKGKSEIVRRTIEPLKEIYGNKILKNPEARTILDAQATALLCEYEIYKNNLKYF